MIISKNTEPSKTKKYYLRGLIYCNGCGKFFIDEDELQLLVEREDSDGKAYNEPYDYTKDYGDEVIEVFRGCPHCQTDKHLSDFDCFSRRGFRISKKAPRCFA